METQAGPNEDSRDDENDDEAEEEDSTEEPHDFSDHLAIIGSCSTSKERWDH